MKQVAKNNVIWSWTITVGMVLIVVGVLTPILGYGILTGRWIFGAGAIINLVGRLFSRYQGDNLRVKRLYRLETWAAIFFCVSCFFQFYSPYTSDWLAFTLAGGCLLVYTSIMIPRVVRKEGR